MTDKTDVHVCQGRVKEVYYRDNVLYRLLDVTTAKSYSRMIRLGHIWHVTD